MNLPEAHFMREDLVGVGLATLLFAAVLIPPGYLVGWLFDLLEFRRRSRPWQVLTSLVLSISIVPIVDYLLWSNVSIRAVWTFYSIAAIFFAGISFRAHRRSIPKWFLAALFIWFAIACLSGIDLQFGNRLFPSVLTYDLNLRTALVDGIARNGLPAQNPLFYPGQPQPLRYHYFWMIPCALVDLLGGKWVNARHALIASNVWCGWALMALVVLYLRYFHPAGDRGLEQRAKWGIALLAIGGLDVIPNLIFDAVYAFTHAGTVLPSSGWWNAGRVIGLSDAVLWVAHNIAACIACLTGFLLLSRESRSKPIGAALCAGLCFASAAGLSIYVTFTFAIFLVIWGARVLFLEGWRQRLAWALSAIVAGVCARPYLHSISDAGGPAGQFAMFAVRSFGISEIALSALGFGARQIAWGNLITLPLNYFIETGVWFALAVLWWRRGRRSQPETAALTMFAVSLLVGSFLRSGVISNNDLGWRSTLIGQMILVIWSIAPLRAFWRSKHLVPWRGRLKVLLAVGLASSVYEIAILRFYLPLTASGAVRQVSWMASDPQPGRRNYDVRQVYERLGQMLPPNAVLQANPDSWDDLYQGLYGMRQTASFDSACGSGFGGKSACASMQTHLVALFKDQAGANPDEVCDRWGINALIVKDDDPVFNDPTAWPWQRPALAANERVRAVRCGHPVE